MSNQKEELKLIRMNEVEATKIDWLWNPYIPFGKITVIQGDPGDGKTTVVLVIAAAVTTGAALPESKTAAEPMCVIFQTAEDGLGDTVKPRLVQSDADCGRVIVIDESEKELSLSDFRIEQAIMQTDVKCAKTDEGEFRKKVMAMYSAQADGNLKSQKKRLAYCERRSGELNTLIKKLFEEHALGSMNDKRFDLLSSEYEKEQEEIETEAAALRAGVDSAIDSAERIEDFLKLTRRYRDFSELTVPMLNEFIERIVVHERGDKWCRHTEQQIDIYLNFIGNFKIPIQAEAERRRQDELAAKMKKREYHCEYKRRHAANGGKPLTLGDARTPEQIAADEAAKKEKWKAYNREYQREYQRKWAREKRTAEAADLPMAVNQ
jgi:hypothetical protein